MHRINLLAVGFHFVSISNTASLAKTLRTASLLHSACDKRGHIPIQFFNKAMLTLKAARASPWGSLAEGGKVGGGACVLASASSSFHPVCCSAKSVDPDW